MRGSFVVLIAVGVVVHQACEDESATGAAATTSAAISGSGASTSGPGGSATGAGGGGTGGFVVSDCGASELADIAQTMPVDFTELVGTGLDATLIDAGNGHHVLQYSDKGVWDPNTCQVAEHLDRRVVRRYAGGRVAAHEPRDGAVAGIRQLRSDRVPCVWRVRNPVEQQHEGTLTGFEVSELEPVDGRSAYPLFRLIDALRAAVRRLGVAAAAYLEEGIQKKVARLSIRE